jgi:hypothetical protein
MIPIATGPGTVNRTHKTPGVNYLRRAQITGGTECYGCRYACNNPINLIP